MIWICLGLVVVAMVGSVVLTGWMIALGKRWGQIDQPDAAGSGGRKNHAKAVPNTGGIAIFASIALPIVASLAAVWLVPEAAWHRWGVLADVVNYLPGLRAQTPAAIGLLVALGIIHLLGLVDDRKRLGPFIKLAIQLAVAGGLAVALDVRIFQVLDLEWGMVGFGASVVITMLWVVVITNAMNFLDNMDGLSGGVAAIIAALFLVATLINGQWFIAALCALLLGSLVGFLVFNFPPAKVFMGDGGSLVVGLLLAVISILTTYVDSRHGLGRVHAFFMPLILLAIPLYDFTSVTLIRLARGQSPFVGDQSHFSHRLVRKGLSKRTAVLVIWLCTLATGLSGVMFGTLNTWQAVVAGLQTLAILALLAILERTAPNQEASST